MAEVVKSFISENTRPIGFFILLFVLFIPVGVAFYHACPGVASIIIGYVKRKAVETGILTAKNPALRAFLIFRNNAQAAATMAFLGITGVFPVAAIAGNGLLAGIVAEHARVSGLGVVTIILSIVPHGVVEIPGVCVAAAGGLRWFLEIAKGRGRFSERLVRGLKSAVMGLLISLPLLAIAALIEAYITPALAHAHLVHA